MQICNLRMVCKFLALFKRFFLSLKMERKCEFSVGFIYDVRFCIHLINFIGFFFALFGSNFRSYLKSNAKWLFIAFFRHRTTHTQKWAREHVIMCVWNRVFVKLCSETKQNEIEMFVFIWFRIPDCLRDIVVTLWIQPVPKCVNRIRIICAKS